MNRLIIIGNGFDLAHNMKTSYYDFITDYIKKCFKEAREKREYSDELIKIVRNEYVSLPDIDKSTIEDLIKNSIKNKVDYIIANYDDEFPRTRNSFDLTTENDFIEHLFQSCCKHRWVDIEDAYYDKLKEILKTKDAKNTNEKIEALNKTMKSLVKLMNNYFSLQTTNKTTNQYNFIFNQDINKDEMVKANIPFGDKLQDTLILNFNYTNTIIPYIESINDSKNPISITVNFIHGNVNDENNKIIFGFGDEMDTDYPQIESEKRKGFLEFIKSFSYFRTLNYHNLIRFIESDIFQVFILGHSCGLSDRTMLNMIFEHVNCKSIKIFYHETESGDNYTEITQEISRHFRNKQEMRDKIVPFPKSSPMPQIK